MRVRELAKTLDIPHHELLERIRRDAPMVPVDSVMSRLTEPDIDAIIVALTTHEPRHDLSGTPYAGIADARLSSDLLEARSRSQAEARRLERARTEAQCLPVFGTHDLNAGQNWSAFLRLTEQLARIDEGEPTRARRELVSLQDLSCTLCAERGEFARVMARRRLAMTSMGQLYRTFHKRAGALLEDVVWLELDDASHQGMRRAEADVYNQLQASAEELFPVEIDWRDASQYIMRDIQDDVPDIKQGLTREQIAAQLQSEDTFLEEVAAMYEYAQLEHAQFAQITAWLGGEEMDYDVLRELMGDDDLTYSATLAAELRRAHDVMVSHTLDHIFGKGEHAVSVQLNHENEHTRYRFMLYAGQGGVASAVFSFEL
jgi:hypothetical protein